MKKFMLKLIFWLILIGILCLAGYQNISFFMNKYAFEINYYFGSYTFPEVYTGLYVAGFFMAGFILSSFLTIGGRFKSGRTIKMLKYEIAMQEKTISALKNASVKPRQPIPSPDTGQQTEAQA